MKLCSLQGLFQTVDGIHIFLFRKGLVRMHARGVACNDFQAMAFAQCPGHIGKGG